MDDLWWLGPVLAGVWGCVCVRMGKWAGERDLFRRVRASVGEKRVVANGGTVYVVMTRKAAEDLGWKFVAVEDTAEGPCLVLEVPTLEETN